MDEAEFVMTTEYESVKSPFSKIRPEDRFNLERNDENAVNAVQQPVAVNVQAAFSKSVAVSKPVTAARRVSLAANFQRQMDDDEHEPAVVSAPRRHSTLGMNNLMVMTQSSKTKMEATKASLEEIKPEKDPWWNERNKERDMRRAHNPVSENIRQHAKSKLLQVSLEELYRGLLLYSYFILVLSCFAWSGALMSFYHVISLASHMTNILIYTLKYTIPHGAAHSCLYGWRSQEEG